MKNLKKFFAYFKENRSEFIGYSFLSFFVGLLELFGVALTYPFVLKLLEGGNYKGFTPLQLGVVIVMIFIIKNVLMVGYLYTQSRFIKKVEKEINLKFAKYFLGANFAEISKISLAEKNNIIGLLIPNVVNNYVFRILNLNVNFFIFILITAFLFIKFTIATIVTILFAVILLTLQNSFFKPKLKKISERLEQASLMFNQRTNEILLNIKGVKISNNEFSFYENYRKAIKNLYKYQSDMLFMNIIPPYITEPFIIILLFVLLGIISLQTYTEPHKLVASFAVIVSAIFRLAPTISRIQVNLNGISSALPFVEKLFYLYENLKISCVKDIKPKKFTTFENCIELKNINFKYVPDKNILNDINLKIYKGEFIGIAGLSGEGKTTLIDVISGLLTPQKGEMLIDGALCSLPLKIGYIPQEISTINASIRENIAFGNSEIHDEKIINVLKQAQLYDFIQANYEDGIYANPFVDNIGLSLGQKQRLAIARALYSEPDVLILDEATSSLDLKTEDEICNVLNSLKGKITIIAVAHRISTIKFADKIAYMCNGKIENFAPFNELININEKFKQLVDLASIEH